MREPTFLTARALLGSASAAILGTIAFILLPHHNNIEYLEEFEYVL